MRQELARVDDDLVDDDLEDAEEEAWFMGEDLMLAVSLSSQ